MHERVERPRNEFMDDVRRQEVLPACRQEPERPANVERVDETDFQHGLWIARLRGGHPNAGDDGLREDKTGDFLCGGNKGMAEEQGAASQVDFEFLVGDFLFPAQGIEADQFLGGVEHGVEQIRPQANGYPATGAAANPRPDFP